MAKDKNTGRDSDLEKYNSLSGVSLREMNLGLWLSQKRQTMLKALTGFLIAACVFLFAYSTYNYFIYFMNGDPLTIGGVPMSPRQVTADLVLSPVTVLASDGHHDLTARIKNPNEKFLGTFEYCFLSAGRTVLCRPGFVLPGEEKQLLALGQDLTGGADVSLEIRNILWRRLDAHQIPDWNAYVASRLNLEVSGLVFNPAEASGLSEQVSLNYLQFSVINRSAYGYYEAPLNIFLYRGSELAGIQRHVLANLLPGETREARISWPGRLSGITRTEVRPDINILDDGAYLKYRGTAN